MQCSDSHTCTLSRPCPSLCPWLLFLFPRSGATRTVARPPRICKASTCIRIAVVAAAQTATRVAAVRAAVRAATAAAEARDRTATATATVTATPATSRAACRPRPPHRSVTHRCTHTRIRPDCCHWRRRRRRQPRCSRCRWLQLQRRALRSIRPLRSAATVRPPSPPPRTQASEARKQRCCPTPRPPPPPPSTLHSRPPPPPLRNPPTSAAPGYDTNATRKLHSHPCCTRHCHQIQPVRCSTRDRCPLNEKTRQQRTATAAAAAAAAAAVGAAAAAAAAMRMALRAWTTPHLLPTRLGDPTVARRDGCRVVCPDRSALFLLPFSRCPSTATVKAPRAAGKVLRLRLRLRHPIRLILQPTLPLPPCPPAVRALLAAPPRSDSRAPMPPLRAGRRHLIRAPALLILARRLRGLQRIDSVPVCKSMRLRLLPTFTHTSTARAPLQPPLPVHPQPPSRLPPLLHPPRTVRLPPRRLRVTIRAARVV